MTQPKEAVVERATVYLTPRNKERLARLPRGEKARKLNEALDLAFAMEEQERAFDAFMRGLDQVEPVEPVEASIEALHKLRDGRDHDVADSARGRR